jgi:hypothetical protein
MIVVLFTITVEGRSVSWKRLASTKTNDDGAMCPAKIKPGGANGAQPMKPPPTRHETQAGAHSMPGTQTQAATGS